MDIPRTTAMADVADNNGHVVATVAVDVTDRLLRCEIDVIQAMTGGAALPDVARALVANRVIDGGRIRAPAAVTINRRDAWATIAAVTGAANPYELTARTLRKETARHRADILAITAEMDALTAEAATAAVEDALAGLPKALRQAVLLRVISRPGKAPTD